MGQGTSRVTGGRRGGSHRRTFPAEVHGGSEGNLTAADRAAEHHSQLVEALGGAVKAITSTERALAVFRADMKADMDELRGDVTASLDALREELHEQRAVHAAVRAHADRSEAAAVAAKEAAEALDGKAEATMTKLHETLALGLQGTVERRASETQTVVEAGVAELRAAYKRAARQADEMWKSVDSAATASQEALAEANERAARAHLEAVAALEKRQQELADAAATERAEVKELVSDARDEVLTQQRDDAIVQTQVLRDAIADDVLEELRYGRELGAKDASELDSVLHMRSWTTMKRLLHDYRCQVAEDLGLVIRQHKVGLGDNHLRLHGGVAGHPSPPYQPPPFNPGVPLSVALSPDQHVRPGSAAAAAVGNRGGAQRRSSAGAAGGDGGAGVDTGWHPTYNVRLESAGAASRRRRRRARGERDPPEERGDDREDDTPVGEDSGAGRVQDRDDDGAGDRGARASGSYASAARASPSDARLAHRRGRRPSLAAKGGEKANAAGASPAASTKHRRSRKRNDHDDPGAARGRLLRRGGDTDVRAGAVAADSEQGDISPQDDDGGGGFADSAGGDGDGDGRRPRDTASSPSPRGRERSDSIESPESVHGGDDSLSAADDDYTDPHLRRDALLEASPAAARDVEGPAGIYRFLPTAEPSGSHAVDWM